MSKYFQYFSIFISGAVVLIIEIGGTRIMAPFFGSTIFVWSSLITTTLGFLALGYFLGGRLADRHPEAVWFYGILILSGASAFYLLKVNQFILVFGDQFGIRGGPLVASTLLFGLPLFLLSMLGPYVIRLRAQDKEHIGHVSGLVFGISTAGSLVGALLAGFYLIPNLSLTSVFTWTLTIVMIIGIIGLCIEHSNKRLAVGAIILLLSALFIPSGVVQDTKMSSIIHTESSFYSDIKIVELPASRSLITGGFAQSVFGLNGEPLPDYLREFKRVLSHWQKDADVLVLGFGAGSFAKIIDPSYRADYVEIDKAVVDMAKEYFDFALDYNDNMIISDARAYLRSTDKKYDVIIIDLYNGNAIPFYVHTKEALDIIKSRLKPQGVVFSNMIGTPDDEFISSMVATLRASFANVVVSAESEELSNILAYASADKSFKFEPSGAYRQIEIDTASSRVITDDRNNTEILASKHASTLTKLTKEVFGNSIIFNY